MTRLEAILEQARELSPNEREALLHHLSAQRLSDAESDEIGVGQRGLAAWRETAANEDWSMYYPVSLRNGGRSTP